MSDTTIHLTQLHRLVVKALCAHGTDAKGTALVFLVEILAAGLTSSMFGFEASSFFQLEVTALEWDNC